jgi:predicted nucleotidyltransferase component of viral defense system
MRLDFVNEIALKLGIERRDLVEKDVILHQILSDLSKDPFFSKSFVFKGGTCLIKCYYGYLRFSEDVDFTWRNQRIYKNKSQKVIRKYLSGIINKIGKTFEGIAKKRAFNFKIDKGNKEFVELGGSNKFCTFKIWYDSEVLERRSFIKIQINFVEKMCFKIRAGRAKSLLTRRYPELKALYPEYAEYARTVDFNIYDIREILSEKVRAVLTRRGTKARDFVDAYLIQKNYKVSPVSIQKCIIKKIRFALEKYERFNAQLDEKSKLLDSGKIFAWGAERELLIFEIDEGDFYAFLKRFEKFLKETIRAVS